MQSTIASKLLELTDPNGIGLSFDLAALNDEFSFDLGIGIGDGLLLDAPAVADGQREENLDQRIAFGFPHIVDDDKVIRIE